MKIISRYVFRQTTGALLLVLLSLTGIVWISLALRELNVVTSLGQSAVTLIKMTTLGLPNFVAVITPFALLITVIHTLNRLNSDSEIIVLTASGATAWTIVKPLVALGLLVVAFISFVNHLAAPWSYRHLREIVVQVRTDLLTQVIQPGRFSSPEKGLTFHIRERGPNGLMMGIFVSDTRDPNNETIYIAERGRITQSDQGSYLILDQGLMQRRQGQTKSPSFVEFQRYAFDMSQLTPSSGVLYRATDRSLMELITVDASDEVYKQDPGRFRAELHKRLASPLFPIAGFILAFAFLGEARTTRQNRGLAIAGAAGAFGLVQILGFGSSGFVARNSALVWLAYLVPLGGILYGLLMTAGYAQFRVPAFLQQFAEFVTARFERLKTA